MQQFDVPFIRRQKQNTDIWKRHHSNHYLFEDERTSHIYKQQHRRKSCYCQLCGKMSLFQYNYMNLTTSVNFINKTIFLQHHLSKQEEIKLIENQNQDKLLRDNINLSFSFRSKSINQFKQLFSQDNPKYKQRKSCDCSQCGNQNAFQKKCHNYQIIKKQQQSPTKQFKVKKPTKTKQYRKQKTEQFSPVKNGELKYLKKRMIELDLNDHQLLKKFQFKTSQNSRLLRYQQSLNIFEISSRQKTDVLSPPSNKKTLLPYLQFPQNRSPLQKIAKKQSLSNFQRNNIKQHNQKSGIF